MRIPQEVLDREDNLAVFDPIAPVAPRTETVTVRHDLDEPSRPEAVLVAAHAIVAAQYHVTNALALAVIARRKRGDEQGFVRVDTSQSVANADFNEACVAHTRARMSQAHAQQQLAVAVQAAIGLTDQELLG